VFQSGVQFALRYSPFSASATLYAQWAANASYTVTFNANGGATVSSLSGADGSSITLPNDTNGRNSFDGWFTAASGGRFAGGTGSSYAIPSRGATLDAKWKANTKASQTITFAALADKTLVER